MSADAVSPRLVMGSNRELGTVALVAGLTGGYATVMIAASSFLGSMADEADGSGLGVLLGIVSSVFILIALYVAAVVITNCVDTVIAGRLRHIALLRLLGSRSALLRKAVMRRTLVAAAQGAVAGAVAGYVLAQVTRVILVAADKMPDVHYVWMSASLAILLTVVVAAISVAALAAGWIGSRSVLRVSPVQALSQAEVAPTPRRSASLWRLLITASLITVGVLLLVVAAVVGELGSAAGFFCAFFGASISATGLLIGARLVIPRVVALFSRLVGTDAPSVLARRNAVHDPLRTTRSTMGLVIGVCLVTTIASGMKALQMSLPTWGMNRAQQAQADAVMSMTTTILIAIVVISSVIAAVGFVSTMSLTVIQRRREIGLLRALGFTRSQVRSMVTKESIALSAAALLFGIGLGVVYGAIGAQSLIGGLNDGFIWGLPWGVLAGVAIAGLALVVVASRAPARRAVAVPPIEALRVDA